MFLYSVVRNLFFLVPLPNYIASFRTLLSKAETVVTKTDLSFITIMDRLYNIWLHFNYSDINCSCISECSECHMCPNQNGSLAICTEAFHIENLNIAYVNYPY